MSTSLVNCLIFEAIGAGTFEIADTKFNFPLATLLTQDNSAFLQQWKSGFKWRVTYNKYQSPVSK